MKKVSVIILLSSLLLSIVYLSANTYLGYTKVVFNSRNENIILSSNKSSSFEIFLNLILNLRTDLISGIKPKTIGIFYTDKPRADNKIYSDDGNLNFSSTKDSTDLENNLIYVYVSDEIINSQDFQRLVLNYTIDTISYYKRQPNYKIYSLLSKYLEIPIHAKNY